MLEVRRRRDLRKRPLTLTTSDWLCFWGVFVFALVPRLFRISEPKAGYQYELDLLSTDFRAPPNHTNTFLGTFLFVAPLQLLSARIPSWFIYARVFNSILSSLAITFTAISLRSLSVSRWTCFVTSLLFSFEFSNLVTSRSACPDQLLLFFSSLALLLLNLSEGLDSFGFAIGSFISLGIASVTDISALVLIPYALLQIRKSKHRKRLFKSQVLVGLVSTFLILDFIIQFRLRNGLFFKLHARVPWFVFPLWKFPSRILWEDSGVQIYLLNHPVSVGISTISCGIAIAFLQIDAIFYFASIVWISFVKGGRLCSDFQMAFLFGIPAFSHFLNRVPLSRFIGFLVALATAAIFVIWSPWVFALRFGK
jgi:hypothetical protein